ncbi:hypothetical protein Pve01_73100 [Planomonospora venezuelensis]|nr:hypothetical protein Pve01_73100 [Planomonospora venezuelensis]
MPYACCSRIRTVPAPDAGARRARLALRASSNRSAARAAAARILLADANGIPLHDRFPVRDRHPSRSSALPRKRAGSPAPQVDGGSPLRDHTTGP